jgi:hypothetical protein
VEQKKACRDESSWSERREENRDFVEEGERNKVGKSVNA